MSMFLHNILGDDRGKLVALESQKQVPFEIKRVFYIYDAQKNVSRGEHSHYTTRQYLIAVSGSCTVVLDNGKNKATYKLDSPEKGVLQEVLVWGAMHDFSEDCVLLVLADRYYDESDYIRDYQDFLDVINEA